MYKMTDTPPCQPETLPDDTDLYCLECGYNLRGLSGDPRRCPECFHMNPVGDLVIPADDIRRQIRKMEGGAGLCVAGLLIIVLGLWSFLGTEGVLVLMSSALVGVAVWSRGMVRFRDSCRDRAGWGWALARYHFYGGCMLGMGFGAWLACQWIRQDVLGVMPGKSRGTYVFTQLAATGLLICVLYLPFRWMYRQARRDFDRLQRETAVQIIRARHRERLERRR